MASHISEEALERLRELTDYEFLEVMKEEVDRRAASDYFNIKDASANGVNAKTLLKLFLSMDDWA